MGRSGGSQEQLVGAPVLGVGAALDQSGLRQLVDQPRQGDRLHLQQFGQLDLAAAFLARQVNQGPRLGLGQRAALQSAFEGAAHQPENIGHQEAETVLVEIHGAPRK
ncbi:hypothetical protein D9M71_423210 [compost metagenome]